MTEHLRDTKHLRENRLFMGLSREFLEDIASGVGVLEFKPGEIIFREGEKGDCLYLVCEGTILISKEGRRGNQEPLGVIEQGNFFGEMALVDGGPRSAQASAVERAVVGKMDRSDFERILDRAPRSLHMNFLRCVVERLRGVNAHYITELMRTERLSLVGTMANSIIHDLKNPIQCIRSCGEILARKTSDPALADFYMIIHQSTERMLAMSEELLDFARGESSIQMQRHPVATVLMELDLQMQHMIPPEIHIFRKGTDCLAEILVDVGRFARMLLNLVKNAVEAMPSGGLLWVKVREIDGSVVFRITDSGCGITPELQSKIFQPFVTFGKSKGTGLGMAIVKNVAEAHGGTVTLESEVNVGTTVEVTVPTAPKILQAIRSDLQTRGEQGVRKPRLRLLLVDDDPYFRDCTAEGLRADGHTVITAEDGASALLAIESGSWDLVVTDYSIPRMDGARLAQESKMRNPELRVLMISGMERESPEQVDGFLQKPFSGAQLWNAIQKCFDVSGSAPA